jgi:hypothetical protein
MPFQNGSCSIYFLPCFFGGFVMQRLGASTEPNLTLRVMHLEVDLGLLDELSFLGAGRTLARTGQGPLGPTYTMRVERATTRGACAHHRMGDSVFGGTSYKMGDGVFERTSYKMTIGCKLSKHRSQNWPAAALISNPFDVNNLVAKRVQCLFAHRTMGG